MQLSQHHYPSIHRGKDSQLHLPTNQDGFLHYMLENSIVLKQDNGLYSITNPGTPLVDINRFTAREPVRMLAGAQATTRYAGVW